MSLFYLLTTREKAVIFGVAGVMIVLVGVSLFLSLGVRFSDTPDASFLMPNLTELLLEREPIVIEKEVFITVPAAYVEVGGRNYTADDVFNLLEAKGVKVVSFDGWVKHLFTIAEGQVSFLFNGEVYGPGEYEIEDVESDECALEFEHNGFDEGALLCGDVEIETEDMLDLQCSMEIFFERNTKYEQGKVKHCEKDFS